MGRRYTQIHADWLTQNLRKSAQSAFYNLFGGSSLYAQKRLVPRPVVFILIIVSFILVACGAQVDNNSWPSLSADGQIVYVSFGPGVLAVDILEEEELWAFPEEFSANQQFFAAPSISEENIVVGDFGVSGGLLSTGSTVTLYSIDRADGSEQWAQSTLTSDRLVAPVTQAGDQIFVGTSDNAVIAISAESGEELWRFPTEHSVWAQPLYDNGIVYIVSLDKHVYALDAENGDLKWDTLLDGAVTSKPVLVDGTLYVTAFDQKLHALDSVTGDEKWTAPANNLTWASPVLGDGAIYYTDISGNVFAVSLNGESLWETQINWAIQNTPAYADGVLYIASGETTGDEEERQGEIIALDTTNEGRVLWDEVTPVPLFSSPLVVEGHVVVVLHNYSDLLYVYDAADGNRVWAFAPTGLEE